MKLEEGKTYKTCGGDVVGPMRKYPTATRPAYGVDEENYLWNEFGMLISGSISGGDIVEEVTEESQDPNPYTRTIPTYPDGTSDIYCVLKGYEVTCPAIAHAVKKLLAPGCRSGGKSYIQDLEEAMQSIQKAIDLEKSQ